MQVIKDNTTYQEEIKHSKFITLLYKVNNIDDVKSLLAHALVSFWYRRDVPLALEMCGVHIFIVQLFQIV